jgi:flavin-dependent dehydrogenase
MFDKHLAQLAEKAGTTFQLETRAQSLLLDNGQVRGVSFKNGEKLASKIVIDAEAAPPLF